MDIVLHPLIQWYKRYTDRLCKTANDQDKIIQKLRQEIITLTRQYQLLEDHAFTVEQQFDNIRAILNDVFDQSSPASRRNLMNEFEDAARANGVDWQQLDAVDEISDEFEQTDLTELDDWL